MNCKTLLSNILRSKRLIFNYRCCRPMHNVNKRRFHKVSKLYNNSNEKTHFGYENVSKEEKAKRVHGVFENVADSYDLMNDLMSGGIHRLWKDNFVSELSPTIGIKLLDVAGGTGDITFRILQYINNNLKEREGFQSQNIESSRATEESNQDSVVEPPYSITVCDISKNMLDVGQTRANQHGYSNIDWVCGDAQDLPFPDNTFDAYTIAFGMRNVVDIEKALSEAYRVLKIGGQFSCLEFSQVPYPIIKSLYDTYSFQMIPVIGQVVAGDWESYQYLVESIRQFPDQERYAEMLEEAGFRMVRYKNMTFGITAIHTGFKI